jgi:hypothetical protein
MGDGRWEMGDGRWEMGDGRWEMGDGRWEMKEHGMFMRTDKEENTEIGDSPGKIAWHGGSAG